MIQIFFIRTRKNKINKYSNSAIVFFFNETLDKISYQNYSGRASILYIDGKKL